MRLVPGCYGKLPVHGDFIRHGIPGPEVDLLDDWIQGGIVSSRQVLGGGWDAAFDACPPQRFVFQAGPGSRVLAGVVTASRDKPGRRFPFFVFVAVDALQAGLEPTLVPASVSGFLEAAEQAALSGWPGLDLKGVLAKVDTIPAAADGEGAKKAVVGFAAPGTAPALWQKMFGSSDDPRRYLLVHNLAETLRPGAQPRYALRLPGISGEPEVAFWLELGRRLTRRPGLPTLSLWRVGRDGAAAGLSLLYDTLKAAYFLPLWWPERKSNLMYPLADPAEGPDLRLQQARERYGAVLEDPGMRLTTLLTRLGQP